MSRSVAWRGTVTDLVSWRQDQAERATMYILREIGPTGFLLKEEGEKGKLKVFLGDPHSCTCKNFRTDKDICQHICWVILKKFRVPRQNEISFQKGLVEREINQVLRGVTQREDPRRRGQGYLQAKNADKGTPTQVGLDGKLMLEQRPITEDDVCPICQDELLEKHEPVTYCRYGCAKSIHIKCMKVWAEHQKSQGETTIQCPLCRENFGPLQALESEYRNSSLRKTRAERLDLHLGSVCKRCQMSPLQGKCYRCTTCVDYCLCQGCFNTDTHTQHSFVYRQKSNQRWRPAERGSGTVLPSAVVSALQNREITDNDYDMLLQLDSNEAENATTVPEYLVQSLAKHTIRPSSLLLTPGAQCRICLRSYSVGQVVKKLPCKHEFHWTCLDQWLLHEHATCPVDGMNMYAAIRTMVENARAERQRQSANRPQESAEGTGSTLQLEIPGIGFAGRRAGGLPNARNTRVNSSEASGDSEHEGLESTFTLTGSGLGSRQSTPQRTQELLRSTSSSSGVSMRRRGSTPPRRRNSTPTRLTDRDRIGNLNPPRREETQSSGRRLDERIPVAPSIPMLHISELSPLVDGVIRERFSERLIANRTICRGRPQPSSIQPAPDSRPSIPMQREELISPLQGRQQTQSVSGLQTRPPLPSGTLDREAVRERGRARNRQAAEIRRRSSSGTRARSLERPSSAARLEALESLFLGAGHAGLVQEQNTSTTRSRKIRKPTVMNRLATANGMGNSDILSANGLSALSIHGHQS